ncbi:hypothetical protein [Endothiovibrio diazotrophicus]
MSAPVSPELEEVHEAGTERFPFSTGCAYPHPMDIASLDFSVSARRKAPDQPIGAFLAEFFSDVPVRSVFAFREYSSLYGGRRFVEPELSEADVAWMYDHGIGYRIPLQTSLLNRADYLRNQPFLARYHRKGNSVIVTHTDLAQWIREDFPDYEIEASVINRITSVDDLDAWFRIYDVVVLHPRLNTKRDELATIAAKQRIRLFANAGCMYRCPTMECYESFTLMNKRFPGAEISCAQLHNPRYNAFIASLDEMTEFDVAALAEAGFTRFKKLRSKGQIAY